MKKQILVATTTALLCTSAWATKARMDALGQDSDRGSFYLQDTRNVFRNAANVAGMNNYIVTEWGSAASADDSTGAPSAEGGFFRSTGSFSYGVYLGSDIDSQNDIRNGGAGYAGTTASAFGNAALVNRDNELDVFLAGDAGIEWGLRLSYANSSAEPSVAGANEADNSSFGLGLGAILGDLQVYANLQLSDESENTDASNDISWEADTGINAGVNYKLGDTTLFFDYDKVGAEFISAAGQAAVTTERSIITIGAAHVKELSSTSRMFVDLHFNSTSAEDVAGTTTTELDSTTLPLTVGFEADATSWLTLRGSISQPIFVNSNKTTVTGGVERSVTGADATNIEAGMTLNFGKLKLDGSIGNTGLNGATADSEVGVLSLDRLATRVAVHYWF